MRSCNVIQDFSNPNELVRSEGLFDYEETFAAKVDFVIAICFLGNCCYICRLDVSGFICSPVHQCSLGYAYTYVGGMASE
jgi:hypothetical protein